jgi:hypothetical protein
MKRREGGENCITRSFAKHNQNDQVEEDEMCEECSTNWGEEERI